MKNSSNKKTLFTVAGIIVVTVICFLLGVGNSAEVNWHLKFHITDKSNAAISGTRVRIHALGEVTPLNKLFHVDIKRWDIDGVANAEGDYQLDARAYVLDVTISKEGYRDVEKSFHPGDPNAGQPIKIEMEKK
jgi:hypothetical protein